MIFHRFLYVYHRVLFYHSTCNIPLRYWLVVYLPLWKIWVRQLGLLFPIYGKIKNVPNLCIYIYIFSTSKRTDRCSAWFGRGHWRAPRRAPVQPLEHVWLGLQDDYAMRRFYANKGGCYRGKGELLYLLFYHLCMFIYIYTDMICIKFHFRYVSAVLNMQISCIRSLHFGRTNNPIMTKLSSLKTCLARSSETCLSLRYEHQTTLGHQVSKKLNIYKWHEQWSTSLGKTKQTANNLHFS